MSCRVRSTSGARNLPGPSPVGRPPCGEGRRRYTSWSGCISPADATEAYHSPAGLRWLNSLYCSAKLAVVRARRTPQKGRISASWRPCPRGSPRHECTRLAPNGSGPYPPAHGLFVHRAGHRTSVTRICSTTESTSGPMMLRPNRAPCRGGRRRRPCIRRAAPRRRQSGLGHGNLPSTAARGRR
jgi:hypothetical protein